MVQRFESPAVVYGADVTEAVGRVLGKLNGKALFVALQPGVNTRAGKDLWAGEQPGSGKVEVLYVLVGEQNLEAMEILKRVRKGTFLVVQASYASPLTERADVVLPMAIWSERCGTLTNTEGLVQEARKATDPLGEAKTGLGDPLHAG